MAKPTAMAMLGPISANSSGLNSFSSTLIFWKGFMIATGMPNLSRRMASRFSTPEPPPARTISSTRSAPDVAGKKSSGLRPARAAAGGAVLVDAVRARRGGEEVEGLAQLAGEVLGDGVEDGDDLL